MLIFERLEFLLSGEDHPMLESRREKDLLIVTFQEERLDVAVAAHFKERVRGLIDAGNRRIILDLALVEFIDSSGLGAIVACLKMLGGDGDIIICGARETVASMFRLTRLDRVFLMYDGVVEALSAHGR